MDSTLAMADNVFFTKNQVFLAIKDYVNRLQSRNLFQISEDKIETMLASFVDNSLKWETEKFCPKDIIKFFRKDFKVKYIQPKNYIFNGGYYIFKKKKIFYLF